eukprot:CAMPEP_0177655514 /NCGR_PEP_ID=MMETSP0447-20121125/15016_1 /TAXON_ID=0 /ORGANISM="Stygamoeba regulata, Strain BSH-02190019" /LENGTH=452 /DNA_ID=CAMNT_0019159455 /DNA_START=17 /DNA_END=1375 /DNA_ORIENTATION=-
MAAARAFLEFVNASPTPFHAVEECKRRLVGAGFQLLTEDGEWKIQAGKKYFFHRNYSTLFAFSVGAKYEPGNGLHIVGAHTDSPCLKVKPKSAVSKEGFHQVGVETYGGGIWHTWMDRDLTIAGRVIVEDSGQLKHRLVHVKRPILRVPTLAIHLDRTVNEACKINSETQLVPVIATHVKQALQEPSSSSANPLLSELLANELGCGVSDIRDYELYLADTVPACLGGLKEEFVFSPRLDNLCSSFCSLQALIDSASSEFLASSQNIQMIALFDHEEVGSQSNQGAGSNMIEHVLDRICKVFNQNGCNQIPEITYRKSFLISADMAHAVHPNYSEKHEANHKPKLHAGPVIKMNSNQRYATNTVTSFLLKELARRNNVPFQDVIVRNDSPCGSTIGPMLSARGLRTIDIGNPQLSMHSIREMCGADDFDHLVALLKCYFQQFGALDDSLKVDQ